MNNLNDAVHWAFGRGFWYADPVEEVKGLTAEQLFWVPTPRSLCAIWHIGHIARAECFHIGHFLQGQPKNQIIPARYDIFGIDWNSIETVRAQVKEPEEVMTWFREVRLTSHDYIAGLRPEDYSTVPASSDEGHSVGQVLFQTVAHTALHIGRIQMLRAMIEKKNERRC